MPFFASSLASFPFSSCAHFPAAPRDLSCFVVSPWLQAALRTSWRKDEEGRKEGGKGFGKFISPVLGFKVARPCGPAHARSRRGGPLPSFVLPPLTRRSVGRAQGWATRARALGLSQSSLA